MSRARHWVFTSYADEVSFFEDECVEYCIFGNEKCPKTARWHKQGYVCFRSKKRLTALKKLDHTAHWELKRGTVQEAVQYCKKDGDYYEYGIQPMEPGCRSGEEFKIVKDLVVQGKYTEIENGPYFGTYIRYKKSFDSYDRREYVDLPEPRGIYVYGEPGTGKDSNVKLKYDPYVKSHNKWWDGYTDEENVLFSDLDPEEIKYFFNLFKQWSDRYPFTAEHKGGSRMIHPKRFIVTSNSSLEDLPLSSVQLKALKRRFTVVDFDHDVVTKRPKIDFNCKQDLFNDL